VEQTVISMDVVIELGSPKDAQVIAMIDESDAYYASLYPADSNHLMDINALLQNNVYFFNASVSGHILGFGAIVVFGNYAEIKRMYVSPKSRGMGVGKKLLEALEKQASALELYTLRLETGIKQNDAVHLYKAAGYQEIEPFENYKFDPMSIFMEKHVK
jgi:putative acetyltransferase